MTATPEQTEYRLLCNKKCENLNEFRENGKYCDIELKVDDEVYACHRNVLAASSEFFDAMFNSSFEEKDASSISLSGDVDSSVFNAVLEFIYTGNITFTLENAYEILRASHYLQIIELENECCNYITQTPNVKNLLEIAEYFILIGRNNDDITTAVHHIVRNMEDIRKSETFTAISYVLLHKIIKNNETVTNNDTSEVEYVEAIFEWVSFNWNDRKYVLEELLDHVTTMHTSSTIIKNLSKLVVRKDKTCINEYPYVICDTVINDIDKISIFRFTIEGKKLVIPTYDNICGRKKFIQATRFNNDNYFLSWDACDNIENTFMTYNYRNILSPPPICTTDYRITTVGEAMFLYDSSEKFIHRKGPIQEEENATYAYNFDIDQWFSVPKVPERLFDSYLASMDGTLYLIGGCTKFCHEGETRKVIQCFDKRSSKWITKPMDRDLSLNGAVCVHRNEIYIYEKPARKTDKGRFHIYNPVGDKFRSVEVVDSLHHIPGVLISSAYEDKLWNFHLYDKHLYVQIYRPLRQEWDEDFIIGSQKASSTEIYNAVIKIVSVFSGLNH